VVHIFWWFCSELYSCRCINGSPISTGIMASTLYIKLKGDSFVVDSEVHLLAHNTSNKSSGHRPLALSNHFRNSTSMTLLAASAWPLVCECLTKLVICLMTRPV